MRPMLPERLDRLVWSSDSKAGCGPCGHFAPYNLQLVLENYRPLGMRSGIPGVGVVCALHCTVSRGVLPARTNRVTPCRDQGPFHATRLERASCLPACLPGHNTLRGACTCACAWGLCLSVSAPCASVSASRARLSPSRMSSLVAGDMLCLPGTRRTRPLALIG